MTAPFRAVREPHAYFVGACRIPSLHEVLEAAGRLNGFGSPEHLERGEVIHELALRHDSGDLDLDSVEGPLRGWLLAYAKLLAEKRPRYDVLEQPFLVNDESSGMLFGTRVDRAGFMGGQMVTDLKTGGRVDWHRLQTAAHVFALDRDWRSRRRRFIAYLKSGGSYHIEEHLSRGDFDELRRVWEEALSCQPELQKLVAEARTALKPRRARPLRVATMSGRSRSPGLRSRSGTR